MRSRRLLPWLALVLVLAGALVVGSSGDGGPRTDTERAAALSAQIRCPTCSGQSVRDSNAPAAAAIRTEIQRRVEEGQGDEDILAYIDGQFSDSLLLTPPRSGLGSLVWILPVAALVVAVVGLAVVFRRWRPAPPGEVSDDDRRRVADALGSQRSRTDP
ncbi:MAG: cytochrome c-type biogenesis protein CcmH [Actinomycetota bacterium]|nr:cytochrome c-type biogenesis protein CcmH [Actinomycetota bacterium]